MRPPADLQFGHGTSAVEILATNVRPSPTFTLQFGHGTSAVEIIKSDCRKFSETWTFNSATARRPWRSRETPARRRECRAFNSATARRPWRSVAAVEQV